MLLFQMSCTIFTSISSPSILRFSIHVNTINVEHVSKNAMIEYINGIFSLLTIMVQVSELETYPRAKMNLFKS